MTCAARTTPQHSIDMRQVRCEDDASCPSFHCSVWSRTATTAGSARIEEGNRTLLSVSVCADGSLSR